MPPAPAVLGIAELAARWGIRKTAVTGWTNRDGFPEGTSLSAGTVYSTGDVESWEQSRRDADLPLPGERPRGPEPRAGR